MCKASIQASRSNLAARNKSLAELLPHVNRPSRWLMGWHRPSESWQAIGCMCMHILEF